MKNKGIRVGNRKMKSIIIKENTLKRDIIINGIKIAACITGEYFNIECPICKKEIEK